MFMKITELSGGVLYIEDAFPKAQDFIDNIERFDSDPETYSVLPPWEDWKDQRPVKGGDDPTIWDKEYDNFTKGKQKLFDWDRSINSQNLTWPRPEHVFNDKVHNHISETIDIIDKPYREILKIWSEKTNNPPLEYISKNYLLRKYHKGGRIGQHIDKNIENPLNTIDWSVLFYLNEDYEGGEISFPELDITIKPSKGSALVFPCTAVHIANEVTSGEKYYIFMFIDSEFGHSTALYEDYNTLNELILQQRKDFNHPLWILITEKQK